MQLHKYSSNSNINTIKIEIRKSAKKRSGSTAHVHRTHSDIYEKFTYLIIDKLEQGIIPWRQPWNEIGLPINYLTKKPYKGINLWILLSCGPYYLTFKQAQALGGIFLLREELSVLMHLFFPARRIYFSVKFPDPQ